MGVDLLDLYRGRMSLRRLSVLVKHLPVTSRTVESIDPDGAYLAAMPSTDYLLMNLYDLTLLAAGGSKKDFHQRPTRASLAKARADAERAEMTPEQRAAARHAALEEQLIRIQQQRRRKVRG